MEFNVEPYWDDFEATNGALENNYMRILFRPGYAVQARELTQLQTILQNQIKQFGDHIFKDGSPVIGGHLTIDSGVTYLKLEAQDPAGQDIDLENFLGVTVFNSGAPKTRAKVIQTYDTSSDRTLIIRYLRGSGFTAGQTISTAAGFSANVATGTFTGTGSTVSINEGVFYVNGFFVTVQPQTIVLDPYSSTPTYRVGLEIDEEIITESVDNALLDPAQESFNYQAPGAHRYQFSLNLAKRTIDSIDDSRFFELLRVENGVITKQVSYPIYSELEKTLARRTYDESGNYEVKPFLVDVSANTVAGSTGNANTFIVNVQPGKAYVKGFEFETIGTTKLASDRARTSTTRKDYNLSLYYGNRVYLSNVQGSATAGLGVSYSALNEVDIHCVAANTVDLTGISANYYSTRIGTAKIRNLDRLTGDTYQLYLTDMDFSPIVATANATTNTTAIKFPPNFSASPNAYQNCIITIVNNFGSNGNVAKITSYDGTNRTAFINPPIKTAMLRGATFSLTIPPEFAESIISANSGFTGANLQANIALGSPSRDPLGNTVYEDATLDTMLYKIPNFYVKYDSDKSVDFFRRILKSTVNFTVNGAATITLTGSDGVLDFGSDGALVSSAERSENIIVVAKTGANAGKIIDMTLGTRSAYRTDSATLTLYTSNGSGTAFDGDIYLTTKLNNANGIARRVKTLVQSNSAITAGDTLSSASAVTGYSDIKINASNGTIWFTSSNVVNKIPGEKTSLFLSDVVKINRIYDSGSISYAPNTTNKTDITDRYTFNSGQTDSYYDHASITLKPGENPPSGQTVVFVDYYTHTGTGYISQKSYANSVYDSEQIPVYKSQTGQLYYLRDCIDMRPLRVSGLTANPYKAITLGPTGNVAANGYVITANTARSQNVLTPPLITGSIVRINSEDRIVDKIDNPTQIRVTRPFNSACTNGSIQLVVENIQLTGGVVQRPTDSMELDYEYYLPRIDRVVATKDKEFKLIQGVPSLTPTPPLEPEDSMSICTMDLPPYTASLKSINIKHIENRRYTMKDIAIIDKRVAQLEDYVRLKESEKNIITDPPKSPETPNINKPIYGTIVDEFNDMTVTDTSPSAEFSAAVEKGLLTCAKLIKAYSLEPTKWSSGDKLFMLGYSETPFVSQPLYSNTAGEVVQSGIIAKFEGFATLSPERDYFYSQTFLPVLGDTSGRYVEPPTTLEPPVIPDVPSTPGTGPVPVPLPNLPYLDPNYTGNIVVNIGANNYTDTVYNEPVLVGDRLPTRRSIVVDIPHWTTQPQISILPQYIDYTETLNVAPITSSNSYVSVNIAATPDTITTSNLTAFNLASIGLAVGGFLAIGQNVGIQDGREERFIKFIDPTGSFIQVDTNFTANLTSANLANVGIIETFTPTVETQTVTYEPLITQQISLDFTSMMPLTYLDDIWAPPLVEPVPPVEYPMPVFAPGWLQETITAPSVDTGFDQIFNSQPDAAPTPETDFNFNFGDFGYWNFDNFYYGS